MYLDQLSGLKLPCETAPGATTINLINALSLSLILTYFDTFANFANTVDPNEGALVGAALSGIHCLCN